MTTGRGILLLAGFCLLAGLATGITMATVIQGAPGQFILGFVTGAVGLAIIRMAYEMRGGQHG